jgi:hypothetical protein
MSYWAQLDNNNKVIQVTVGDDDLDDAYQWLIENHGGTWVQTHLDNYAGIGWTYLENVGFYPPKPFASWTLDGINWKAPIDKPEGNFYWDEDLLNWVAAPDLHNGK